MLDWGDCLRAPDTDAVGIGFNIEGQFWNSLQNLLLEHLCTMGSSHKKSKDLDLHPARIRAFISF